VITGVVVAGLSTHGHHANLADLGASWLIAVGVSFTISLELVVLAARTLGSSLRDLQRATDRVRAGDFSARVPVVATDETGALAQSFNTMVEDSTSASAYARPSVPTSTPGWRNASCGRGRTSPARSSR
jgi:adenylate cyclase